MSRVGNGEGSRRPRAPAARGATTGRGGVRKRGGAICLTPQPPLLYGEGEPQRGQTTGIPRLSPFSSPSPYRRGGRGGEANRHAPTTPTPAKCRPPQPPDPTPHPSPLSTELPYSVQPRGSRPRRGWARGGAEILSSPPRPARMRRAPAGGRGGGMQGGRDGGPALAPRLLPLLPPVREGGVSPRRSRHVTTRDSSRRQPEPFQRGTPLRRSARGQPSPFRDRPLLERDPGVTPRCAPRRGRSPGRR